MDDTVLDEAYARLHATGPEWGENRLTNHGPMAAEVLVRRGHADQVPGWLDAYTARLDELPAPHDRITDATWRDALGDGRRIGDWTRYLVEQTRERPWRDVLLTWWPRLLPGIVAGATHGVIRTGHAVRTLLGGDESPAAVTELAHALAFWAARSLAVPGAPAPSGALAADAALDAMPRVPDQSGPIAHRFGQFPGTPGWSAAMAALRRPAGPDDARDLLTGLVDAATVRYLGFGHASPVLLVHSATAPNAVLRTLPALPRELWAPSLSAVWAASAAIVSAFAPAATPPSAGLPTVTPGAQPEENILDAATEHGDEHVIKFADTAADVYARTGAPEALAAARHVADLIDRRT